VFSKGGQGGQSVHWEKKSREKKVEEYSPFHHLETSSYTIKAAQAAFFAPPQRRDLEASDSEPTGTGTGIEV